MDTVYEVLKSRRSIRKYKPTAVEKEKVDTLLKAALMSPASKRSNPWHFVVVDDKNLIEKLSKSKPHGAGFLKGAPLAIAVCADQKKSDVWIEDASIASIIIQLTAQDMGLGSCWTQIRKRLSDSGEPAEEYVKDVLQIPDNLSVESIIGIGYPDEDKAPFLEEKMLTERLYSNSYLDAYKLG